MCKKSMNELRLLILGKFLVAKMQEEKVKTEDDKLLMELADIDYDNLEENT